MTILVDSRYFGDAIRHGRENARTSRADAARIFGMTQSEYLQIERGTVLPPTNMMFRITSLAFIQLRARRFSGGHRLLALKPDPDTIKIVTFPPKADDAPPVPETDE